MSVFDAFNANASALTAQRLRMDVTSSNIANANSTRARVNENGEFEPYRRKMIALEPNGSSFKSYLHKARYGESSSATGVRASQIVDDTEPFRSVYEPEHPDADEDGFVDYPNVDPLKEMTDMMGASRSYEANITSLNTTKDMLLKALEIGK